MFQHSAFFCKIAWNCLHADELQQLQPQATLVLAALDKEYDEADDKDDAADDAYDDPSHSAIRHAVVFLVLLRMNA